LANTYSKNENNYFVLVVSFLEASASK